MTGNGTWSFWCGRHGPLALLLPAKMSSSGTKATFSWPSATKFIQSGGPHLLFHPVPQETGRVGLQAILDEGELKLMLELPFDSWDRIQKPQLNQSDELHWAAHISAAFKMFKEVIVFQFLQTQSCWMSTDNNNQQHHWIPSTFQNQRKIMEDHGCHDLSIPTFSCRPWWPDWPWRHSHGPWEVSHGLEGYASQPWRRQMFRWQDLSISFPGLYQELWHMVLIMHWISSSTIFARTWKHNCTLSSTGVKSNHWWSRALLIARLSKILRTAHHCKHVHYINWMNMQILCWRPIANERKENHRTKKLKGQEVNQSQPKKPIDPWQWVKHGDRFNQGANEGLLPLSLKGPCKTWELEGLRTCKASTINPHICEAAHFKQKFSKHTFID